MQAILCTSGRTHSCNGSTLADAKYDPRGMLGDAARRRAPNVQLLAGLKRATSAWCRRCLPTLCTMTALRRACASALHAEGRATHHAGDGRPFAGLRELLAMVHMDTCRAQQVGGLGRLSAGRFACSDRAQACTHCCNPRVQATFVWKDDPIADGASKEDHSPKAYSSAAAKALSARVEPS